MGKRREEKKEVATVAAVFEVAVGERGQVRWGNEIIVRLHSVLAPR